MRAIASILARLIVSVNYRTLPAGRLIVVRAGFRLDQAFFVDQRAPLPVVEVALLLRQARRLALDETALDEPAGSPCGQDQQARQAKLARALLDFMEQRLAVAFAPEVGMHGQCRKLAGLLAGKGIQRRAADDHAVVLRDDEALDLHLQPLARAADQHALI